jgi:hypothetical protein
MFNQSPLNQVSAPLKLIAFSLWGDNPKYLVGALRNAELAAKLYPDWICRFYCADDLTIDFLNQLRTHRHVEIVLMPPKPDRGGAVWRFFAASDKNVSYALFRDTDSRLSPREVAAVNEWMASGKAVHLMRDHPLHKNPMMAGMWGCKGNTLMALQTWMTEYQPSNTFGSDQQFLADVVYPTIKADCLIHDSFELSEIGLDVRAFPTPRVGLDFVGQVFDAEDIPNANCEQTLVHEFKR